MRYTLLPAAEIADQTEDEVFGVGQSDSDLPEELRFAHSRLEKIRAAKAALEAEAREEEDFDSNRKDPPADGVAASLPKHKIPKDPDGNPAPKAQRNFIDGESRIQKTNDGFIQGFNCQTGVDAENQIIVAQAVTNQPPDAQHLVPMIEQVITHFGQAPTNTSADAGYFSESNIAKVESLGTDAYIATGRQKRGQPPVEREVDERRPETAKEAMSRKLRSAKGMAVYSMRKAIVEPVFGPIKQGRGFRQFLLRGLLKVRGEWALICLTHNLLKLYNARLTA